jgi:hypothetical protein
LLAGKCFRGGATVDPGDKVREIHAKEISAVELVASVGAFAPLDRPVA